MSRLTCGHIQHMYSWWWVRLSPETCRVKPLRRIKTQLLHLVGLTSLLSTAEILCDCQINPKFMNLNLTSYKLWLFCVLGEKKNLLLISLWMISWSRFTNTGNKTRRWGAQISPYPYPCDVNALFVELILMHLSFAWKVTGIGRYWVAAVDQPNLMRTFTYRVDSYVILVRAA